MFFPLHQFSLGCVRIGETIAKKLDKKLSEKHGMVGDDKCSTKKPRVAQTTEDASGCSVRPAPKGKVLVHTFYGLKSSKFFCCSPFTEKAVCARI